ncbi:MAG: branched-chain amino acid aminotransferase I [Betaproteobacteria bacterium RIFCSPLOWO2_02_67_12]|nr:MAG: branched-chain amino acid aminotransferase I [Betaproteobacteria bacterium RIFCSPLOWO2_02_67_12]OGA28040.1 MAG: branched-chain amino acid aminotransferase I [Betaproteobacteria bacterium RIFCSPLOWO2_02_FULL_68_150]OGA54998.1 MAG: branched-chain amino acid aminotransferase I [Betaproteobacteria bacterium RIFCSPLOWO2_12_FULL_67_28]
MESNSSSSPEAASPHGPEYVGFWKRVAASLIDTLILLIVIVPLLLAVYGTGYLARAQESGLAGFWDFVIQVVLPAVAVILFWKYRGATPGKMAISARIVDARSGAAPSTGQLVGRYFAYLVSALPLGLGFFWIGIDRRKQGFHDKLANTVVVYDDD